MIAEWETNHLFLSDRLEMKEPALFASLCSIFNGVTIIPGTADIWCRDFMPIQIEENKYCQFVYDPDYFEEDDRHLILQRLCA